MLDWLEAIDRYWLLTINAGHHPVLDEIMWIASAPWHTWLLAVLCGLLFWKRFKRRALAFYLGCAIVAACTDFTSNTIKHTVKRYRPTHNTEITNQVRILKEYSGGQYGFFSGHAANSFGLTMFVFQCFRWMKKKRRLLFFIYPAAISYSRMYLGVHYPADIFIGMIDGLLIGWVGFLVMNKYFLKLDEKTADHTVRS